MARTTTQRLLIGIGAFGLMLVSGYVLAGQEGDYGSALLTAHKLTAVGIAIVLAVAMWRRSQAQDVPIGVWLVVALASVAFTAMVVSGSVLSAMSQPAEFVALAHRSLPYVTAVSVVAAAVAVMRTGA